jgi:hypothetical protein
MEGPLYRVKVENYGWLPQVNGDTDYAGYLDQPITALAFAVKDLYAWDGKTIPRPGMTTPEGWYKYAVRHRPASLLKTNMGYWLKAVTARGDFQTSDPENDYAGTGSTRITGFNLAGCQNREGHAGCMVAKLGKHLQGKVRYITPDHVSKETGWMEFGGMYPTSKSCDTWGPTDCWYITRVWFRWV